MKTLINEVFILGLDTCLAKINTWRRRRRRRRKVALMVLGGAGVEAAPCLGVAFLGVAQGPLGSVQEKLHNLTISKGFLIRIYVSKGVVI